MDLPYQSEDPNTLSREQLLEIVQKLRQPAASSSSAVPSVSSTSSTSPSEAPAAPLDSKLPQKKKKQREFDMSKFKKRHVALKVVYFGWKYNGFASQAHTDETVEAELFKALQKTCLIKDRESCNYSRCGRTDKGVSALGQVVAFHLRSNLQEGYGIVDEESEDAYTTIVESSASSSSSPAIEDGEPSSKRKKIESKEPRASSCSLSVSSSSSSSSAAAAAAEKKQQEPQPKRIDANTKQKQRQEIDYAGVLNRVLPDDIRVIAWSPVPSHFSARFSCLHRTYKYFFVREDLDIDRMRDACSRLVGDHDFRNFCKMDAVNVSNFRRVILSFDIQPVPGLTAPTPYNQMYEMTICGYAFLWHQVRCMASVLFMVGRRQEEPEIIDQLLNLEYYDRKPQYPMASEIPLILYDCGFEEVDWQVEQVQDTYTRMIQHVHGMWYERSMFSTMLFSSLQYLKNDVPVPSASSSSASSSSSSSSGAASPRLSLPWSATHADSEMSKLTSTKHIKLADRATEETFEEKMENMSDRKKALVKRKPAAQQSEMEME